MKIARNDVVEVIAGADKGKQGRVIAVDRKKKRVTVEKVRLRIGSFDRTVEKAGRET